MNDEIEAVSRMLEQADPSRRPGLKERVWRRATAPKGPVAAAPLRWLAPAAALAAVFIALQPGPVRPPDPLYSLAPDWRSRAAYAAERPPVSRQTDAVGSKLDRVDRIERAHLELDALYWAGRVALDKDVTFEELEKNSQGWIMRETTRAELFSKIRDLLRAGKVRRLTPDEERRQVAAVNQAREVLGTGPLGTRTEQWPLLEHIDRVDRETLDESAHYWAWRVAGVGDVAFEALHDHSEHWIMKRATRDELFARIRRILDAGRARPLDAREAERFESGRERVRALLR